MPRPDYKNSSDLDSRWSIQAEALWLQRTLGSNVLLGQTVIASSGAVVDNLSTGDVSFAMQPGMKLRVGYQVNEAFGWEAVYFGMQDWSVARTIYADPFGSGSQATSPWTQAGSFGRSLGYLYSSQLQNAELNLRREYTSTEYFDAILLAGFRFLQWNESLDLNGAHYFSPVIENIDVQCRNNLVGGQIGGIVSQDWDRFHASLTGKAALFANVNQLQFSNTISGGNSFGFVPISVRSNDAAVAGALDGSVNAWFDLTDHFTVRAGYQLLLISGLGLAPRQMANFTENGTVFLQGPSAGVEVHW
jgi:hypothetical protein